jgi:abortive infection alpha-like protein
VSDDDMLKAAKEGISLVGEVIKAAGNDPHVRIAAKNLGESAVTITETIKNALLPLAAVNFAFDKAREYFNGRFQIDLSEKAAAIPQESIVQPKASIAGPALQGLAFSHEEIDLKAMYISLLATAMDSRVANTAHPAFVEIIKQIEAEEAQLIRNFLRSTNITPIVELRLATVGDPGYVTVFTHLLDVRDGADIEKRVVNPRMPAMVDNWIRLGLVRVSYADTITDVSRYAWIEQRPEMASLRSQYERDNKKIIDGKGIIHRTQFGVQFATAVGLL